MCLPVKPYKIEKEWVHAGLSCAVVQGREAGSRCGYVRVPPGHSLHGKDYQEVDVAVHGGLTFSDLEPCTEHSDGQGWWLGFDCAHFQDALYDPDIDLEKVSPETRSIIQIRRGIERKYPISLERNHFWSEQEVVAETEHLAEQLAEIGGDSR